MGFGESCAKVEQGWRVAKGAAAAAAAAASSAVVQPREADDAAESSAVQNLTTVSLDGLIVDESNSFNKQANQ